MYIKCNTKAQSHYHCYVCLSVALVIQQAKCMCHIVICCLSDSTLLFHFIS